MLFRDIQLLFCDPLKIKYWLLLPKGFDTDTIHINQISPVFLQYKAYAENSILRTIYPYNEELLNDIVAISQ